MVTKEKGKLNKRLTARPCLASKVKGKKANWFLLYLWWFFSNHFFEFCNELGELAKESIPGTIVDKEEMGMVSIEGYVITM